MLSLLRNGAWFVFFLPGQSSQVVNDPLQKEFPVKCYDHLGCFVTGEPFYHPQYRPISLLPFDIQHLSTKFLIFTRQNVTTPQVVNSGEEFLCNTPFNPFLETKVIIHGFLGVPKEDDPTYIMKDALLKFGDYNVIIVDWSESAQAPYFQAIANARVVAAELALFINTLVENTGASTGCFHLIGHSFGAHLAGWAGERIWNLGRITGLDPAGPYFYEPNPAIRLDAGDASFVDVIHTNGGTNLVEGLGLDEAIGHIDFYPNGGRYQPGCYNVENTTFEDYDPKRNGCSHETAIGLFIASISSEYCLFESTPCDSFENFTRGYCNRKMSRKSRGPMYPRMGFHAKKPRFGTCGQKFYLSTTASPPYC